MALIGHLSNEAALFNQETVAATAADNDLVHDLARMREGLITGKERCVQVFRSRNEAKKWIRERVRTKFGVGISTGMLIMDLSPPFDEIGRFAGGWVGT